MGWVQQLSARCLREASLLKLGEEFEKKTTSHSSAKAPSYVTDTGQIQVLVCCLTNTVSKTEEENK